MSIKVLVPIADGSEEIEAITIIDTLRRAGAEVTVASVTTLQITASRGTKIVADKLIADCANQEYDMIALPGGMPGAEYLRDSKELVELLKKQERTGKWFAAICASPAIVLQTHGLLNGRKATCFPSFAKSLSDGSSTGENVVVDKKCITSRGPGTALEFSLKLVELLFGIEKTKETAKAMIA
jgi:protein deglycase